MRRRQLRLTWRSCDRPDSPLNARLDEDLLLGENGLEFGKRIAHDGTPGLNVRSHYRSLERKRHFVSRTSGRAPLVPTRQFDAPAVR